MDIHNYESECEELKSCPFCGSKPVWFLKGNINTPSKTMTIKCPNCGVQMVNSVFHKDISWLMDVCVTKWNRRNG